MRCKLFIPALALLLFPLAAFAVPTGLNIMPTAEALGIGQIRADYETDGSGKLYVAEDDSLIGTQGGAILGVEGGIDQVDSDTVYNAKWVFKGEGLVFPALAVGAQNIRSGEKTQYYLVATKSLAPKSLAKVHAGLLRDSEGDVVTMLGANTKLGPLVLKADMVSGGARDTQAISAGWQSNAFTFTATRYFFDGGEHENTFTVSYFYGAF